MTTMNRKVFFSLLDGLPPGNLLDIQRAYWLSKEAHRQQERDGGQRYFEHPRDVAVSLIQAGFRNRSCVIKALLHDVVEDGYVPSDAIVMLFGHSDWESLLRLSKKVPVFDPVTGKLIGRYKKDTDEYYRALAEGPEEDQLVKVADRRHNLGSMDGNWALERQQRYAIETRDYVLPMARRVHAPFAQEIERIIEPLLVAT